MRLDGLSFLMAVLITGIGGFIILYAQGYMHGHPQLGRFFLYLLSFMGAMLGLVLSDNLILLFIFWELTSITSYLLIGFKSEYKESRMKALQALLVTGLGAMAMLAGFVLLAHVTGTWKTSEINNLGELIHASPLYAGIVILILIGAFTKSAQVPFHFWLPNAIAGPTPVSAFLHSATMVKAGVFLMARMNPSLSGTGLWEYTLAVFGSFTLLLAMFLGLFQKDVKSILAYTTLGVLGVLTMLLGIGSEYAIKAMIVFLPGHALYKATLFMVVGSVDHETGTRDVTLLRGLRKLMPITAIAGGLAALSMSGLPPFFGFIGKELIYKAGVKLNGLEMVFLAVALLGNLVMMGLALKAGIFPFFFWLPASYHTPPSTVSAIFAGLLTKVGVYALFRAYTLMFVPIFSEVQMIILFLAIMTMITGVFGAASHFDMRRILSFHIVSQIGYMVLGLAFMTPLAIAAAIFYLVHHIIVKTNLFLVSGVVIRLKGSSDLSKVGGLAKSAPWLAALFFILARWYSAALRVLGQVRRG